MHVRRFLVALLLLALAACTGTTTGAGGGSDALGTDAGTVAPADLPGESAGYNNPNPEICDNELDDDDDGMIDEGCGCEPGTSRPCYLGPPDTRDKGICTDGVQSCMENGEFPSWGACLGVVLPTTEIIENGFDDDCDGTTDEGDGICLPRTGDVGEIGELCQNGLDDDCDTLRDCLDPGCAGTESCPTVCVDSETTCFGGVDDDCDGTIDCDDDDCADALACQPSPCPDGQTPTYHLRDLGSSYGASSIVRGDGEAIMPMTCEPGLCDPGLVAVEVREESTEPPARPGFPAAVPSPVETVCEPPPPPCPDGTHATHVATGEWRCDAPCDLVIHYGSIYSGLNRCAGIPELICASGQVPTFVFETETWECRSTCNNGLYDRIWLDTGMLVCVPC